MAVDPDIYERQLDIVTLMMQRYRRSLPLNKAYVRELEQQGFSSDEITRGMSWMADRLAAEAWGRLTGLDRNNSSIRLLGAEERRVIDSEAWALLSGLTTTGVIAGGQLESVIERALAHHVRFTKKDARAAVIEMLFATRMSASRHAIVITETSTIH